MTQPIIRLEGVAKRFGGFEALRGVDLQVGRGMLEAQIKMAEAKRKYRSASWFGKLDKDGFIHRSWVGRGLPEGIFDGRPVMNVAGSSSGAGTAASFWAANVGTETSGSLLSPANQNMLVSVKPTVGRISRYGVIPITADQDTAGPMAKYVSDIAIMFGALESGSPDPNDAATNTCTPPPGRDYTKFLKVDGLKGARIGIPRKNISHGALRVLYRLNEAGFQAFLVGGAVRDLLLGGHPKDFDIATNATPEGKTKNRRVEVQVPRTQ